ncbi:uncharacterized protein J3R85_012778 [Psidium guajava]|nr:uncharacterized protein J3R85_012778 [Psidium guajava]
MKSNVPPDLSLRKQSTSQGIHIFLYLFHVVIGSIKHDPKILFSLSNSQFDLLYSGVPLEFLTSRMGSFPSSDSQYTRFRGSNESQCSISLTLLSESIFRSHVSSCQSHALVHNELCYIFDGKFLSSCWSHGLMREVKRFADLSADETIDLWLTAKKVGGQLEHYHKASSLTFTIQDGPQAGQTVPHVHVHILPRKAGDFKENDEIYDAIDEKEKELKQNLDLDKDRKDRSFEEMVQEAGEYRKLFL